MVSKALVFDGNCQSGTKLSGFLDLESKRFVGFFDEDDQLVVVRQFEYLRTGVHAQRVGFAEIEIDFNFQFGPQIQCGSVLEE